MARTDTSLAVLSDTLHLIHSRMERFIAEFEWAEKSQVEPYGPKPISELRADLLALSKRYASTHTMLCIYIAKAALKDDSPSFPAAVEELRKDAKAWLADCEAWLSDARVAIPYKIGVDGRPLGKE